MMTTLFERQLASKGITIPSLVPPVANYIPWSRTGDIVFISGQVSLVEGKLQFPGRLGEHVTVHQGQQAARFAALNICAYLKDACAGDLGRVKKVLKVVGFVASVPDFAEQPKVVNGASDLFVEIFGERGRHARSAVGVAALPLGASVEIEAVAEIG